jgi:hypothetical protein
MPWTWWKRRRQHDDDIQDEIRAHLRIAADEKIADGADPRTAVRSRRGTSASRAFRPS